MDNIWPDESRIDTIAQNGNNGEHYDKMTNVEIAQDLAINNAVKRLLPWK